VREVWLPGGPAADRYEDTHYVDITASFDRKLAALRAHRSQTGDMADLETFLRERLTRAAVQGGLPEGSLAETFRVIDTG
jgi:LmbE family N-acetylglucosaminyl deacetylase